MDRKQLRRILGQLALGAILATGIAIFFATRPEPEEAVIPKREWYGFNHHEELVHFDGDHLAELRRLAAELKDLQTEMNRQQVAGRNLYCSRQFFEEAKWLVHFTGLHAEADKKLAEFRRVLVLPKDPHPPAEQSAKDGAFACCTESWEMRMDESYSYFREAEKAGMKLKYAPRFLDRINSPEKLTNYFEPVLISNLRKDGINHRKDLNLAITGLARYILRDVPRNYKYHPELKETLRRFMDERWQDPETGYWGPWFATTNGIYKAADLSITFHIISFRKDRIQNWPKIIATTFAMKDGEYPYGWLQAGKMSNHHNYDVVRIFRLGWRHMTRAQKEQTAVEIRRMIDWCLRESLDADGGFKRLTESTYGSAQNFGVKFLMECGYLEKSRRFWTREDFPEAEALRKRLIARLEKLENREREAQQALDLLTGREEL
jgi:hypothetical protein